MLCFIFSLLSWFNNHPVDSLNAIDRVNAAIMQVQKDSLSQKFQNGNAYDNILLQYAPLILYRIRKESGALNDLIACNNDTLYVMEREQDSEYYAIIWNSMKSVKIHAIIERNLSNLKNNIKVTNDYISNSQASNLIKKIRAWNIEQITKPKPNYVYDSDGPWWVTRIVFADTKIKAIEFIIVPCAF